MNFSVWTHERSRLRPCWLIYLRQIFGSTRATIQTSRSRNLTQVAGNPKKLTQLHGSNPCQMNGTFGCLAEQRSLDGWGEKFPSNITWPYRYGSLDGMAVLRGLCFLISIIPERWPNTSLFFSRSPLSCSTTLVFLPVLVCMSFSNHLFYSLGPST